MKYHYSASDFDPIGSDALTINSESINDSLIDCDHIQRIKKDINTLQDQINVNHVNQIADIEKLQKELQEFKKDTNKFLRHLIDTSIILSVAIVFILILIIFYYK